MVSEGEGVRGRNGEVGGSSSPSVKCERRQTVERLERCAVISITIFEVSERNGESTYCTVSGPTGR